MKFSFLSILVSISTFIAPYFSSNIAQAAVDHGIYQISPIDSQTSNKELSAIGSSVGQAEVVALGEAKHTNGTFHKAIARIARYLIEEKGFRLLTLETSHRASATLSQYMSCTSATDLTFGLQRILPQFASMELRELYTWVRQFNCDHPNDQVSFTGFDVQQNNYFLAPPEMNRYLAKPYIEDYIRKNIPNLVPNLRDLQPCGPSAQNYARPTTDEEMQRCAGFIGRAFGVVSTLPSGDQFEFNLGLWTLFYHAQAQRFGSSDPINNNTWRDIGMWKTLTLIREAAKPGTKTIVIAHNTHVFRAPLPYFKNMGAFLDDTFGEKYFVITTTSSELSALPFYDPRPRSPADKSVENTLKGLGLGALLVNAQNNSVEALKEGLEIQTDTSTGAGVPLVPIRKLTDLLIYTPTSEPMTIVTGVIYPPPRQ